MAFFDVCDSVLVFFLFNGIEFGLEVIGVFYMWSLGYIGYGCKVFVVDIGYDIDYLVIGYNFVYQ